MTPPEWEGHDRPVWTRTLVLAILLQQIHDLIHLPSHPRKPTQARNTRRPPHTRSTKHEIVAFSFWAGQLQGKVNALVGTVAALRADLTAHMNPYGSVSYSHQDITSLTPGDYLLQGYIKTTAIDNARR